jgi:sugar (pentulose or hexulose) kinase
VVAGGADNACAAVGNGITREGRSRIDGHIGHGDCPTCRALRDARKDAPIPSITPCRIPAQWA